MTTARRLTALEKLADNCKVALDSAYRHRADKKEKIGKAPTDIMSYREGEAFAYNDAEKIMKAELERLRNLWQNGALSYSDFGLPT